MEKLEIEEIIENVTTPISMGYFHKLMKMN
jgi:hypothetical protein